MSYTLAQMTDILLAHLTVELGKDGTGENICSMTKQPGDSVALDYAECGGMAWVRLVQTTTTVSGYLPDVTADHCFWDLAHTLELGVMRPAPIPEAIMSTVDLPDDEELSAAADAQYKDMKAMHRAIVAARKDFDLLAGSYAPLGPTGGTVGGTWSLTVTEE